MQRKRKSQAEEKERVSDTDRQEVKVSGRAQDNYSYEEA